MEIPTIVKSQDGKVFFLQFSKFSHRYDAKYQPIFDDVPTLSWHDGFDLSYEYQDIVISLITESEEFEVCRWEQNQFFMVGSGVPYFDFCCWVDGIEKTTVFDSVQSLFSSFVESERIQLSDNYQHPSWLNDIFWLLDFNSSKDKPITKKQITATIELKRKTYFSHYPLSSKR